MSALSLRDEKFNSAHFDANAHETIFIIILITYVNHLLWNSELIAFHFLGLSSHLYASASQKL